jgi:hypothetical protein
VRCKKFSWSPKTFEYDINQDCEGQNIDYKKVQIVPVCEIALTDLLVKCRAAILTYFGKITAGDFFQVWGHI